MPGLGKGRHRHDAGRPRRPGRLPRPAEGRCTVRCSAGFTLTGSPVLPSASGSSPAGAEALVPEEAERLPVALTEEETLRVEHACAPGSVTEMELELLSFRAATQDWQLLVHLALTAAIPAPRIARLAGLDPQDFVQAVGD
ncbi:DUF6003 family protein [Streptomyces sp. MMS24-I31]